MAEKAMWVLAGALVLTVGVTVGAEEKEGNKDREWTFTCCEDEEEAAEDLALFQPIGELESEARFGGYVVRTYRIKDPNAKVPREGIASFEILRGGERVFGRHGFKFEIGGISCEGKVEALAAGRDVTGDGEPNVVVGEFTGGAHCCFNDWVFEAGEGFRLIEQLKLAHGGGRWVDLDGKPGLEVEAADWAFAYWETSYAGSPAPRVVLRYDGAEKKYVVAVELMRKPGPDEKAWGALVARFRGSEFWAKERWEQSALWGAMLDLIYTGHAERAWELADAVWPADRALERGKFLRMFRAQLRESRYWEAIEAMNAGQWPGETSDAG